MVSNSDVVFVGVSIDAAERLRGALLLMPAVSVGNVGQLCLDVLAATPSMAFAKVGYLNFDSVLPVSGFRRSALSGSLELCAPLEVYYSERFRLVLVQQRAPVIPSERQQFGREIVDWCESVGISSMVLVSSTHAYRRSDEQLSSRMSLSCVASPLNGRGDAALSALGWPRLHLDDASHLLGDDATLSRDNVALPGDIVEKVPMPGSGATKPIVAACVAAGLDVTLLLAYVHEGYNAVDGIKMAEMLSAYLSQLNGEQFIAPKQWAIPPEWENVFGRERDQSIYT